MLFSSAPHDSTHTPCRFAAKERGIKGRKPADLCPSDLAVLPSYLAATIHRHVRRPALNTLGCESANGVSDRAVSRLDNQRCPAFRTRAGVSHLSLFRAAVDRWPA